MAKKFKFNFDFGLKQGERGADGLNGLDGIDGRDGVDGINGTDGLDGISPRFRYAVTANKDTEPVFIADNINPGSIWGAVVPMYTQPQAVWMIQAEVNSDNTLASNWTGPVRVTGIDGLDGTPAIPPNYKIFMFRQSEELPAKPTYTNIDDTDTQGWVPWTDMSSGVWWEVSGDVNGVTGDITNWSEPIRKTPVIVDAENGEDGDSIETRRAYGQSPMTAPSVNRSLRVPPGWDIDLGTPPAGNYYVWEISARIKADNTLGGTGQWSIPYRLTGDQGEDGFNGATPEFRWAVNNSFTTPPAITLSSRNPGAAWSTTMPGIPSAGQCIWETHALINEDNTLYSNWVPPRPKNGQQGAPGEQGIQGEQGPIGERGPTGADGTSGIPGVSYENRFSLGTDEDFLAIFNGTVAQTRNPSASGWSLDVPEPTSQNPYIWMIQARIQRATNEDPTGALEGVWSVPFRLSGVNGLPGNDGNSQVVYPQGVFDNDTAYIATERVAPYVFDPLDGNFYVANFIGSYTGNEQGNRSPSQDYANNGGIYWQLITAHEAIFAKLGIISNGLIGSAVFNTDYMFSQQGVNSSGDPSTNYELFDPQTPTGGDFTPNMMINFANGEARFARGNVVLGADGSVDITGRFESNSIGSKISIDPDSKVIVLINDQGREAVKLGFDINHTPSGQAYFNSYSIVPSHPFPEFRTMISGGIISIAQRNPETDFVTDNLTISNQGLSLGNQGDILGFALRGTTFSTNTTANNSMTRYSFIGGSTDATLTLPASPKRDSMKIIKNKSTGTGKIIINGNGKKFWLASESETIPDVGPGSSLLLIWDGNHWSNITL